MQGQIHTARAESAESAESCAVLMQKNVWILSNQQFMDNLVKQCYKNGKCKE